jgi:hypothetical protein
MRLQRALVAGVAIATMWVSAAGPAAAASYTIETITANRQSSEPSLAVDATGHRHVAFVVTGADAGIHYATNASGSWVDTLIPSTEGDHRPSIALAPNGSPAIAFAAANGGVQYASLASGWSIETVSAEPGDAEASLAFDPSGAPHIAMRLGIEPEIGQGLGLFYASPDGAGGWTVEQLTSFESDHDAALAIDSTGRPHIGYNDGGSGLMYLTNVDGSWSSVFVASGSQHLSLAVGTDDRPQAAISSPGDGTYLVTPDGDPLVDPWTTELIAEGYHDFPSLAIDSTGADHVAYVDGDTNGAAVAAESNGAWSSVPVGSGSVEHVSLAVDPTTDRPVLASDPTEGRSDSGIAIATQAGDGSWSSVQVSVDAIDRFASLALDPSGGEHVAFVRIGTGAGLYYASKVGATWQSQRLVEASDFAGVSFTTVAVDTDEHTLRYATNRSGSWTIRTIQTSSERTGRDVAVGTGTSVYLPYTAFGRRQSLTLADVGGQRIQTKVLDRGGFYSPPSIDVDPAGKIHLAYMDSNQLMYASNGSGHWKIESVPGGSVTFLDPSIAASATGKPSIVLESFVDNQVHVFSRPGSVWTDTAVPLPDSAQATFVRGPSVDVDGDVREIAVLAGPDDPNLRLYRISDRSGSWVVDDVAAAPRLLDPSIAVEGGGSVGIVFGAGGSLRIARG